MLGVAQFVVLSTVGIALAGISIGHTIEMIMVASAVGWGLWRLASVSAVPDRRGLRVRNVIRTTTVEWNQIVGVQMGGSSPWVTLDVSDGESLAVMAIQQADGARGEAEAQRLADLVARHTHTPDIG